jgi:hypothetical protein
VISDELKVIQQAEESGNHAADKKCDCAQENILK